MNKNEKTDVVSQVKEMINNASAVYLTDYTGINVADISAIRNNFRKEGVTYKVIKNTLFQRAINESGKYDKLADHLTGMTGYAFKKLALKACYVEDQYYPSDKLNELATLPSKNELIASILGSIEAPVSGIVGAINAVMRDLVSVIDEISKKEAA